MKKLILFLWQLPQNLIGLLVILFTKSKKIKNLNCWVSMKQNSGFGVSLGDFIIFGNLPLKEDIKHEQGHQKQSLYLSWLYLFLIGIPSAIGNIYDRLFHKRWSNKERIKWYYEQPWEKWADKLGKVER